MQLEHMSREQVKGVQRTCNGFTRKWVKGVTPLRVDGVAGKATKSRIMRIKFWCGWGTRGPAVDHLTLERFRHPKAGYLYPGKMLKEGRKRRRAQAVAWAKHEAGGLITPGVVRFDGKWVCKYAVPSLKYARAHGWHGYVVSGWRSPAYSDSLCWHMCGAPRCPGRCAGSSSNHSGKTYGRWAIDVSDYDRFGWCMSRSPAQPHCHNSLGARDPVHFSPSGN